MKKLLLFSAFAFLHLSDFAAIVTANSNNGDWTSSGTWSPKQVPAPGDLVIIPAGITVLINNKVTVTGDLNILVSGTLSFAGGSSNLTVGAGSQIIVFGGGLIFNGNGAGSHIINIGNVNVYKGNKDGDINGPQYVTQSTGKFVPLIPLPVHFTRFTVAAQNLRVLVQWTTDQEQGAGYFSVERSRDGHSWEDIGRVQASGASSPPHDYRFTDPNPAGVTVYYRVKEVDHSGLTIYSEVKRILLEGNSVEMRPMSDGGVLLSYMKPLQGSLKIRFVSLSGQVVQEQVISNPSGEMLIRTSLRGHYVVSVGNGTTIIMARQIIL